jgi:glycosyltransferase involved in cell wall biosynthesis
VIVKILQVIPSLSYSGAAKQISLLAAALPRKRFDTRVCVIGDSGPFAEPLQRAGVVLEVLGCQRGIDVAAAWRLRALLKIFAPDVIHVWQPSSLWALGLLYWGCKGRMVVSCPCVRGKVDGIQHRWFLGCANRVITSSSAELALCRRSGLPEDKLIPLSPAVEFRQPVPVEGAGDDGHTIVCVGPLERHKGYRDAIWTFDILRYVENALQLVVIGDGPDRPQIERFAKITRARDIRLPGVQPDVAPWLARAELVWVPSLAPGGLNVALEAMALGKPVIATRVAGMDEVVIDGETGFLIAPGDKVALARRTRQLLHDAALRQRLGEAGRRRAAERFTVAALVERLGALYEAGC